MKRHLRLNPRVLLFVPLLLVLIAAVACGEDATSTPRPTATSGPTATAVPPTPATAAVEPTATSAPATPRPTATQTSTPPPPKPTPTPGFATSTVERLVLASAPPTHGTNLPWAMTSRIFMVRPMFEPLIGTNRATGAYKPNLATKWEVSPDATAWTLWLQEDVQFHFGFGEFTSKDVVHSWERTAGEDAIGSDVAQWRAAVEKAEDIEMVNDHQVVFNLTRAFTDLDFDFTTQAGNNVVVSKSQWDEEGKDGMVRRPSGTGSYRYVERAVGDFFLFERVENHWRRTPEFKELIIQIAAEDATRLAMMLTGEAHLTTLPKDLQETVLERGMKRVLGAVPSTMAWFYMWGGLHFTLPESLDMSMPATDKRVREAMNRAIDREEIKDTIFGGNVVIAQQTWHHPSQQGWDPSWEARFDEMYGYDPDRARELLVEAGYPDGFGIKIYDYPNNAYPEINQVNEALALSFQAIGINAELETVDYAVARVPLKNREMHGFMIGYPPWGNLPPFKNIFFMHTIQGSFPAYESEFIDEKFAELTATIDRSERDRLQRELGEHLFSEYALMPMFYLPRELIIDPAVIAEYQIPGNYTDTFTHLEYIEAAQ